MPTLATSRIIRYVCLAISLSWLSSCGRTPPIYHDTIFTFGTLIEVTLADVDAKQAQQAMRLMRQDLEVMNRVWHAWKPGSLARVNQLLETTSEFTAPPSVLELLIPARELSLKSQGLFNPAIGRLIALWGFHSDEMPSDEPPAEKIRELLQQHPSMQDIEIHGVRMRSSNPAVQIDLGGIAKGYALEKLMQTLQQLGINNAVINAGGDLKVIGTKNGHPWSIGIRDPRHAGAVAGIEVTNGEAVFTSGDYERHATKNPKVHHIIDPRTGYPATGSQSVTVLHTDATTADAAATALFIAGPKQWRSIAKAMGVTHVMLIDSEGIVHLTPAMQQRIQMQQQRTIVVEPLEP